MGEGMVYGDDCALEDGQGHSWRRLRDWVEPVEADRLVGDGMPFAVQWEGARPVGWWPERYVRDVRVGMLTRAEARRYVARGVTLPVLVGELWRSGDAGDLLLFVERGPSPRGDDDLVSAGTKAELLV